VFGDIHGQRRLSHTWPRRDYDHLRRMQAAGHPIELYKASGDSSDAPLALVKLLDRLDRFHYLVFHGKHLAFEAVFTHRKDCLFYFVEQIIDFILLVVSAPNALRAC
jgi:hypothetical protein